MKRARWPFGEKAKYYSRRRRYTGGKTRCTSIQALEPRVVLNADPTISEFQAINSSTLRDEDGDFEDWIEKNLKKYY